MSRCAIISAFYYIGNDSFTYENIPNFVKKVNNADEEIDFCSIEILTEFLNEINTRLIDRQSLCLEAAIKIADDKNFFADLNKSELCLIAGSYSSSIYPSAKFNLSTKEKGPNFVNATEFTNTVGNAAISRACIWNQFRGETYAISEGINSGLDAVVDAYKNIEYGNTNDVLACATEEVGSAVILVRKLKPGNSFNNPPIAYIKNSASNYVGNVEELKNYFVSLIDKFDIDLSNTDFYLSGDFDKVKILSSLADVNLKEVINKNIWSLTPIIDIGRSLYNYKNGAKQDSLIFSVDAKGFVSGLLLTKGGG